MSEIALRGRVERDAEGIECPECGMYARRGVFTARMRVEYDCGRGVECCGRQFTCRNGHRLIAKAESPEME